MNDDAKFQAAAGKPGRPKGSSSGGYIEIDAPAEVVWSIVGDWATWGDWNPLYIRTAGEPRVGNAIDMTVSVPGMKPLDAKAVVKTYRPNECFEYGLSQMGGMLKAFRFVDVEEIAPSKCGVANGETVSGPVGRIVGLIAGAKVGQGLQAMNAKLKELAEAKAQEQRAS